MKACGFVWKCDNLCESTTGPGLVRTEMHFSEKSKYVQIQSEHAIYGNARWNLLKIHIFISFGFQSTLDPHSYHWRIQKEFRKHTFWKSCLQTAFWLKTSILTVTKIVLLQRFWSIVYHNTLLKFWLLNPPHRYGVLRKFTTFTGFTDCELRENVLHCL